MNIVAERLKTVLYNAENLYGGGLLIIVNYMKGKYKFANYKPSMITFYNQDRDVLLKEPSLIAVLTETDAILALGNEVQKVIGKVNDVLIGSPLKNGVVADFELAEKLFKFLLIQANSRRLFVKPKIAVCVPIDMTQVEYRAFYELILQIGAKDVLIIDEPFERAIRNIPYSYKIIIEISPEIGKSSNVS